MKAIVRPLRKGMRYGQWSDEYSQAETHSSDHHTRPCAQAVVKRISNRQLMLPGKSLQNNTRHNKQQTHKSGWKYYFPNYSTDNQQ
jgi:hypothetical protein